MEEKNQKELDKKFIMDSLKKLGVRYGLHETFADVVKCCAYSFANAVEMKEERENEYLRTINKYNKEERDLFPKILAALVNEYEKADEPIDVLGNIYEDLQLTKKGSAQFFTPIHICDLMSKMTLREEDNKKTVEEKGYINILDPACGSGRFLYTSYGELQKQGIEPNKILLQGDDLDLTCCCISIRLHSFHSYQVSDNRAVWMRYSFQPNETYCV